MLFAMLPSGDNERIRLMCLFRSAKTAYCSRRLRRPVDLEVWLELERSSANKAAMSELCGNPAAETGEALIPSELFSPPNLGHLTDFSKRSTNSTDQEFASNVKLIMGTW